METTTGSTREHALAMLAALDEHDLDAMEHHWHPDVEEDFVAVGTFQGAAAVRAFFAEVLGAFPDFHIAVDDVVGDEQTAVVQWTAHATFTGTPFQGLHATGRPVELRGCDVMSFQDGRLRHNTVYYDGLGFARRLGLLPAEGTSADRALSTAFNLVTDLRSRLRR